MIYVYAFLFMASSTASAWCFSTVSGPARPDLAIVNAISAFFVLCCIIAEVRK